MKTRPPGDANRAMVLQALRAGPMTAMEMAERWSFGSDYAYHLKRAGLVELVEDEFRITPAGRAACPCRNPLAATAATPPEIFTMPKGETHVTRQQVLAAILVRGPSGATRKELIEKFASRATEQAIDMHLTALNRQSPPVVYKPRPSLFIDIRFKPAGACVQDSSESDTQTALTATDDTQAEVDIHGVSLAVDHHEAADLPASSLATQMAQIGGALPAIVEDIRISDPEDVEFCVYSSGGLEIIHTDGVVTLDRAVLAKLRDFLGLFREAA